jgi:hypothetical protein
LGIGISAGGNTPYEGENPWTEGIENPFDPHDTCPGSPLPGEDGADDAEEQAGGCKVRRVYKQYASLLPFIFLNLRSRPICDEAYKAFQEDKKHTWRYWMVANCICLHVIRKPEEALSLCDARYLWDRYDPEVQGPEIAYGCSWIER